ncbi:RNA methyltransferase [Arenicella xantha]|uniref:tRNA (cytidine/uridine-2'-O-)-methyltransferase TrmJ n=1 Tax=Arenicella xantha TaxID=644221 RepID=A0A395JK54_9GAMM|nr:RNA methyltransferase [Arenicella xantha]RBP49282.1 tRNA (cytidine32/uridine32-2'-O)-methyltransferase [Arenicella xantha]
MLNHIRVVLVEPTHPGNIGSVARAMKTMGLSRLVLVNPKKFPHYEASKLAAGAESVLEEAEVVESLELAIGDCTSVVGTSVRDREVSWPTKNPRESAATVIEHLSHSEHQVAILFGRESSGLSNAELDRCDFQIRIPANLEYSSLNLANAVQIIAYELRMQAIQTSSGQLIESQVDVPQAPTQAVQRQVSASKHEQEGYLSHLQNTLLALDFVKVKPPTVLMRKLTRLYNKADLSKEEIQILRGILSAVDSIIEKSKTD